MTSVPDLSRSPNDLLPPVANEANPPDPPDPAKALNALFTAAGGVVGGVEAVPKADVPNLEVLPTVDGDPNADFFSGVALADPRADVEPNAGLLEPSTFAFGVEGVEEKADEGLPKALPVGVLGGLRKGEDVDTALPNAPPNAPVPALPLPKPVG